MPLSLFWGRRVDHSSIFCDVRGEHDPAYECLVTDLVRIASRADLKPGPAATTTINGFRLGSHRDLLIPLDKYLP